MFETSPPPPTDDADSEKVSAGPIAADLAAELADPMASVVGVEVSRRFVRLAMCWAEPVIHDLAGEEPTLRQTGGPELAQRVFAQRFYRRLDAEVYGLLRGCVPLAHAEFALDRIEEMLRAKYAEIIGTAISYLLSDDRDVAIQMPAVAITMAGREVRSDVAGIIADTRLCEDDH